MKKIAVFLTVCMLALGCATPIATGPPETPPTPPPDELLAAARDEAGYGPVFAPSLSNAIIEPGGWAWEEDVLTAKGNGDIWSRERYGDFALQLEFRTEPRSNSGVFLRCGSIEDWLNTAIEVQILQNSEETANWRHRAGAIYDILAPAMNAIKAPGEWNHYLIIARGPWIWVYLNEQLVTSLDLDLYTRAGRNPDGTRNKFKYAYAGLAREGHIGLQWHGDPIWFRNVRVKPLP